MASTAYSDFYAQYDQPLRQAFDVVTRDGLAWVASTSPALLIPTIIMFGVMMAAGGMSTSKAAGYGIKIALFIYLVVMGAYIPLVRDMIVDTIPNELASRVNGARTSITVAQQFDRIDDSSAYYTSLVLGQTTGIMQIGNRVAVWFNRGGGIIFLQVIFYIWIAMRQLTYLAVCLGAFMMIFLPFDATRQWVMGKMATLVGLVLWQLAASILLKIQLDGAEIFMRNVLAASSSMSIEQQIDQLGKISGWYLGMFVGFVLAPTVVGVYGGQLAGSGMATGMLMAGSRSMVAAGNTMSRAAHRIRNRK